MRTEEGLKNSEGAAGSGSGSGSGSETTVSDASTDLLVPTVQAGIPFCWTKLVIRRALRHPNLSVKKYVLTSLLRDKSK